MLNLIMTHSPRMAAMANGKRFGEDVARDAAVMYRLAWLRTGPRATRATELSYAEQKLREQTT